MLALKRLITFLVEFLSHNSNYYISRYNLELAVQDAIEINNLGTREQEELNKLLKDNLSLLLETNGKYFSLMKYAVLPFLKR